MKVFAVHQYLDKIKCKFNVWSIFGPWLGVCCYLTKHVTSQVLFSHVFDFERGNTLWWIDTTASQLRHILTPKKATLHHVNIQIYKSQGTALMRIMEAYIIGINISWWCMGLLGLWDSWASWASGPLRLWASGDFGPLGTLGLWASVLWPLGL